MIHDSNKIASDSPNADRRRMEYVLSAREDSAAVALARELQKKWW